MTATGPFHGNNGRVLAYIGSSWSSMPNLKSLSIDLGRKFVDTTSMGDVSETSVAGLPNAKATLDVFLDQTDDSVFNLADGNRHYIYVYPNQSATTPYNRYIYGNWTAGVSFKSSVTTAAEATITLEAAAPGVDEYIV